MAGRTGGSPTNGAPRGRRLQTVLFSLALALIAGITVASYLALRHREEREVDERAAATAEAATTATATLVDRAVVALGGSGALVDPDGNLDRDIFRSYAADVASEASEQGLALLAVVDAEDREAFERDEVAIVEVVHGREPVPAPDADRYYPVLEIGPMARPFTVIGADYGADPVRGPTADQAVAERATLVTGPTELLATGERAVIVLHPLFARGPDEPGEAVGFVASALLLDDLLEGLVATLPPDTELRIVDGERTVVELGDPDGPSSMSATLALPGRTWRVTVEASPRPGPALSALTLVVGSAAWLGVLMLMVVTVRHQRRLRRTNRFLADAEQRSRTMERLAGRLSQSLSGADVAGAVLESLHVLTGATGGAVAVRSHDGEWLDLLAAAGYGAEPPERITRTPLSTGSILEEAMRSGQIAYLSSPLAWRDDETLPGFASIGMAAAVVPLMAAGEARGVLVVSQPSVRRFEPDERSLLETLSVLVGNALARSLRYDAEHASSLAFQRASLPATLPETDGLLTEARYRPATSMSAVGGDWYDVVALDDGLVAVVVGDIVGHGVQAAASMGHLRSAVRVLAGALAEPADVLRSLSAEIGAIPGALGATMAYGLVDPRSGTFRYLLAGHPPPLLLRADGGGELLAGEPWPPLGVTLPEEPGVPAVLLLPGDTVVLYTDGVVERRGESLTVGLERLRAAGEALGDLDLPGLCDALLEALLPPDEQADDVALVAIRLTPPKPGAATRRIAE